MKRILSVFSVVTLCTLSYGQVYTYSYGQVALGTSTLQ